MLPLYLLTSAKTKQVLIELKSGESLNGNLVNCDSWMNLTLEDVIQTSANGDAFLKIPSIYVRGTQIKYLRLPEEVMEKAKEQNSLNMENRSRNNKRRGYSGGGDKNFNGQSNQNRRGRGGSFNNRRGHSSHHGSHRETQNA